MHPILALPLFFVAADGVAGTEDLAARVRELQEDVRQVRFLERLDPTLEQAEWMLHSARLLAKARAEFETQRAALLSEQKEAFSRFRAEDEQDRGFSPEVERVAAVLSHRMKELEDAHEARVSRLEASVRDFLSPAQRKRIEDGAESLRRAAPRPPSAGERVQSLLARSRGLPEADYRRREGLMAETALRGPGARPGLDREELLAAMRRFRAAKEEELPDLRKSIVETCFPGVRAEELSRSLAALRVVPAVGRLGRFLDGRVAVIALEAHVKRLLGKEPPPEAAPPRESPGPAAPGEGDGNDTPRRGRRNR